MRAPQRSYPRPGREAPWASPSASRMDRSDCESTANRPTNSPTIAPLTGAGPGLRARYPVPATSTAYRCRSRNPRTVPRTLHSSSTTIAVAVPICATRTSADCLCLQHPLAEDRLPGTADPAGRDVRAVAGALVLPRAPLTPYLAARLHQINDGRGDRRTADAGGGLPRSVPGSLPGRPGLAAQLPGRHRQRW